MLLFSKNSIVLAVKSARDTKGIVKTLPNPDYYLKDLYIKDNKMIRLKNIFHRIYNYLHICFNKHKTYKTFNIYKCSDNILLPKNIKMKL